MLNTINENYEDEISTDVSPVQDYTKDREINLDLQSLEYEEKYMNVSSSKLSTSSEKYEHPLIDDDEEEFKVKITQALCVKFINMLFISFMTIGVFLLISFWISDAYNYNYFPFKTAKANDWSYQLAQIIFLMSYWTTNILLLRILVIVGYIFFIYWAAKNMEMPSIDFYLFTYMFVLINLKNIIDLIYSKRIIKFDNYREQIYREVFKGFMTKSEYKILMDPSLIRELPQDGFYCKINDKCNNLSIMVKGRIRVYKTQKNIKTTFIEDNEFIDSAEWLLRKRRKVKGGRRFNYFMKADEKCIYITWPREILNELIKNNPEIENKIDGALGLDVSNKLFNNSSLY